MPATAARRVLLTAFAGALAGAAAPGAAQGAYPGTNGPVLYSQLTDHTTHEHQLDLRGDLRTIGVDAVGLPTLFASNRDEHGGSVSPDGAQLAFVRGDTIWIGDTAGTAAQRLTPPNDDTYEDHPEFSPDGNRVLYSEFESGILAVDRQGTGWGTPHVIVPGVATRTRSVRFLQPRLTPDGTKLLFVRLAFRISRSNAGEVRALDPELWIANADGSAPRRLIRPARPLRAVWSYDVSPDGTKVVYGASANAKGFPTRIVIASIDGSGPRTVATTDPKRATLGGMAWSPDGTSIAITQNGRRRATSGRLDLLDPATGARRTLVRTPRAWLQAPTWLRAAPAR